MPLICAGRLGERLSYEMLAHEVPCTSYILLFLVCVPIFMIAFAWCLGVGWYNHDGRRVSSFGLFSFVFLS